MLYAHTVQEHTHTHRHKHTQDAHSVVMRKGDLHALSLVSAVAVAALARHG